MSYLEKINEIYEYFTISILNWSRTNFRQFFWRKNALTPFQILIIEILLERTRADSVEHIGKYFIKKYPNAKSLLKADFNEVEKLIRPLGLFRKRIKAIKNISEIIVSKYDGIVPEEYDTLIQLPFIGRYTASAILCFAFNKKYAIVDSNIARIIVRYFNIKKKNIKLENFNELWEIANRLVPEKQFKTYNWTLIDLGATICKKTPICSECPLSLKCKYSLTLVTR